MLISLAALQINDLVPHAMRPMQAERLPHRLWALCLRFL